MSRVSNSLRKKEYFASLHKRMSQYLLLFIARMLFWYKSFGEGETQYITYERKTLYASMMPGEISHVFDDMGSVKKDGID